MAKPVKMGRKPIAEYCIDCHREGLRPPKAGPKQYGSYCKRHMTMRQKATHTRRTTHRAFVLGQWDQIPETEIEAFSKLFADEVARAGGHVPARTHKQARIVAKAFEYACMDYALQLSRKITELEEDQIIELYCGSRTGVEIRWSLPRPGESDDLPLDDEGKPQPILLPDANTRQKLRAESKGGPVIDNEPRYQDYYEAQYGYPVSDELFKQPENPNDSVIVIDPELGRLTVPRNMLAVVQADIQRKLARKQYVVEDPEELPEDTSNTRFGPPSGDAIKSFSQRQAEANNDGQD